MATTNLQSAYTSLSGARTQGQLENTRERQRQLHDLHVALQGAADELLGASHSSDSALNNAILTQIAITLSTIESHINTLGNPQSSSFDPTTSKPAGIALILTEDWAPISTSLVPLAAALAAGCQSLIVLPPKKQRHQEAIWEVIGAKVLTNALDDASFALVEFEDFDSHATRTSLRFDIGVSQGTSHAADLITKLSQHQVSGMTILESSRGGHSAAIIDRGYKGSFADVGQDLLGTMRCAGKGIAGNEARLPRILFVDEFIAEKCMREIEEVAGRSILRRLSGKSNDYVEVSDIKESLYNLPGTEHVVFVVTTSSLDDVIDRFNKLNHGIEAPVVYIFAEKPEADYLAQFINSQHSIVGGIPLLTQLLNNPPTLFSTPQTPYPIQSFSKSRPVYRITCGHPIFPDVSRNSKLSIAALKARKVLDVEARRSKGGQISYFTQGLMVSLVLFVLPTLGTVFYGGVKLVGWWL